MGICSHNIPSFRYPLVISHSYRKWPIEIVDLPIQHGDFPVRKLLEKTRGYEYCMAIYQPCIIIYI